MIFSSDAAGLPEATHTEIEVSAKAEDVFRHVYLVHPMVLSPLYSVVS